jgi:hypothetical protein
MGKMKTTYLILISAVLLCFAAFADETRKDISTAEYIDGIYIPRNLEEAWAALEKDLTVEDRQRLKTISEDELIGTTFFGSMGIRNDWGLWRGSRLAKYFNDLGIYHPDDMSGIILRTFWCHINNKPIRLEERIAYYKEYWLTRSEPPPDTFPEKNLTQIGAQHYETPKGLFFGWIRIYRNEDSGKVWLYEYNKGWKIADDEFFTKYPHWKDNVTKNP